MAGQSGCTVAKSNRLLLHRAASWTVQESFNGADAGSWWLGCICVRALLTGEDDVEHGRGVGWVGRGFRVPAGLLIVGFE